MESTITVLLRDAANGDRGALDDLFQALYPDLRRVAHARLYAQARAGGMGTTVLVHESFIKLMDAEQLRPADRAQFFMLAAKTMRQVIVDELRAAADGKPVQAVAAADWAKEAPHRVGTEALAVHQALGDLERLDASLAQVVEMRYFGGYTEAEIAELTGVTERTVRRRWIKARAVLHLLLKGEPPATGPA